VSRISRIYCPTILQEGQLVTLPESAARHTRKVLRLRVGDRLRIFDGAGHEHEAVLAADGPGTTARIGAALPPAAESTLSLTLMQGVSRGERMDWVVQKATELGVARIVPVLTARSVVRLSQQRAEQRREHWQAITISACEQCGRRVLPELAMPRTLDQALAEEEQPANLRLMPSAGADLALPSLKPDAAKICLLIGPEGGLDEEEEARAGSLGFVPVSLGPRVLRTETAAVVALAACQTLWGDFNANR